MIQIFAAKIIIIVLSSADAAVKGWQWAKS